MNEQATPSEHEQSGGGRRLKGALAALLTFLAGPPIGATGVLMVVAVESAFRGRDLLEALQALVVAPALGLLIAPLAFLFAGVPAFLAAIMIGAWIWRGYHPGYVVSILVALVAVLLSIVGSHAVNMVVPLGDTYPYDWDTLQLLLPVAAGTAVVLRAVAGLLKLV